DRAGRVAERVARRPRPVAAGAAGPRDPSPRAPRAPGRTRRCPIRSARPGGGDARAPHLVILDGQERQGYWVKPGSGYGPKYTGTAWSVMFLDQMGADPRDRRIQRACTYVLEHTQAPNGAFGWRNRDGGGGARRTRRPR